MHRIVTHPNRLIPFWVFILTLIIYIMFAGRLKFEFPTDPANYFSHLSWSFLNGRLDLINPTWNHDLSIYNGKLYIYWGPTPVLLIIPIIFLFGVNISDGLYTALFSTLVPVFVYLSFQKMEELGLIHLSNIKKALLTIFLAFGTVFFSIAVRGGVWFTSQAFSTLYILISIYLIFSYLRSKKVIYLILSSLFLCLASWGRMTFFFYVPIFLALIVNSVEINNIKLLLRKTVFFIFPLIIILAFTGLYNYLRFESIFENGYNYQNMAPKFVSDKINYGYFNPYYINHNFYYNFINPPVLLNHFPFFKFDPEGNSFLILSPLFLLTPLIFRRKHWKSLDLKLLNGTLIFCILFITIIQLNFFGTGWFQFNARYLLDVVPLLIILLAEVMEDISVLFISFLVIASIFLNTLGTLWLIGVLNG